MPDTHGEPKPNRRRYRVNLVQKSLSRRCKIKLKIAGIVFLIFLVLCVLFLFIGFPIIFMHSIDLQRQIMFTTMGLPNEQSYFEDFRLKVPGLRNLYLSVKDEDGAPLSLGMWHLLPHNITFGAILNKDYDYDDALRNSNFSVLLYFHGNGEARSYSVEKYQIFRLFFHVVAFDYRSYADSTKKVLSEDAVVDDSVQLYEWLYNRTEAPIYLWGHSLGTAIATRVAAIAETRNKKPAGLVLEAAFTTMGDELFVHPIGKIFAWLPWFKATVVEPIRKNGFIFDTSKNILEVDRPIMLMASEDDPIVPYRFGRKLFDIASGKSLSSHVIYYQFPRNLGYSHFYIYEDPLLPQFIENFIFICENYTRPDFELN